jgi:hypothetical protein
MTNLSQAEKRRKRMYARWCNKNEHRILNGWALYVVTQYINRRENLYYWNAGMNT